MARRPLSLALLLALTLPALACTLSPELTTTGADTSASSGSATGGATDSASSTSAGPGDATDATAGTGDATDATSTSTTGSTTGDATTDASTGDESTGCNFICDDSCGPDDAVEIDGVIRCSPPGDPCDVWAQDCPDGEKCSAYASSGGPWDAVKCVPIVGEALPGEPCQALGDPYSGDDTCALGAMCFGVDPETLQGVCVGLCGGSPDAPICGADELCLIANDGALNLCLQTCSPLDKACPEGQMCAFVGEGFACTPSAGDGVGVAESCTTDSCADGLSCVPGPYVPGCDDTSCCTAFCDLEDPGTCADQPKTECVSFYDGEPPPELANLGLCVFEP
ncbi:MAG: hypothetical protein R3A79_03820 [Nannocystaceae bacterium]